MYRNRYVISMLKQFSGIKTIKKILFVSALLVIFTSCASIFNKKNVEYKPVQYAKNDYRVLKKENRYTGTFMIRQKSNGFFIPDEKISVDMDIVISSLKVPYLRVSYYGCLLYTSPSPRD